MKTFAQAHIVRKPQSQDADLGLFDESITISADPLESHSFTK